MPWQPDYCTLAELKGDIRIPSADTDDDAELAFAITAASRAIDQITNRQFGQVSPVEARVFTARFDRRRFRWVIDCDDISSSAGLLVAVEGDDDEVFDRSITDFRLVPANEGDKGRPWTGIVVNPDSAVTPSAAIDTVQVTALWGWTAIPDTIVAATIRQAARFYYRREAPFGVAGSPATGSEIRLLSLVDPDVAVMVRPYRRVWGAA